MPNFDGQYEVRLNYTTVYATVPLDHIMTFDVKLDAEPEPGTPFDEVLVSDWNEASSPLDELITSLVGSLGVLFHTSSDFTTAELWKIPEGTFDATFLGAMSVATAGLSSSPTVPAGQVTLTWRSIAGGIMKMVILEGINTEQGRYAYPTPASNWNALFDYISNIGQPFMARDNTRPFAPLRASGGQNEAVWRKRFRP